MNVCQLYAFKDHKASPGALTNITKVLLVCCAIIGSLLLGAVAVEFPSGLIVGLCYLIGYGLLIVGGFVIYLYVNDSEVVVVSIVLIVIMINIIIMVFVIIIIIIIITIITT